MTMSYDASHRCRTHIEDAVSLVISMMDGEEMAQVRDMAEEDLMMLHFGFGERIRNECGLWENNKELRSY